MTHHQPLGVDYVAISYTWGSTALTHTILCDGMNMSVTANCYAALLALRRTQIAEPVWIDAICIDQRNLYERNAQVSRMGSIFQSASSTIVYPGYLFNDLVETDQLEASAIEEEIIKDFTSQPQGQLKQAMEGSLRVRPSDEEKHRSYANKLWQLASIYREPLFQSRWVQRTWIIQEVMFARNLYVILGWGLRVPLEPIVATLPPSGLPYVFRMRGKNFDESAPYSAFQAHGALGDLRYRRLPQLMQTTRHFECQDPRDKLFALLPLFEQPVPATLTPDYSKRVSEVYTDLAWFLIDHNLSKRLSLAGISQASGNFPSWVVDWTDQSSTATLEEWAQGRRWKDWKAGHAAGRQRFRPRRDGHILILRGMLVDNVRLSTGSTLACMFRQGVHADLLHGGYLKSILSTSGQEGLWDTQQIFDWVRFFFNWKIPFCVGRSCFFGANDQVCFGPAAMDEGDRVCVFLGYRTPFVLRPVDNRWVLVGECYVPGLMLGEAMDNVDWSKVDAEVAEAPLQDFYIY